MGTAEDMDRAMGTGAVGGHTGAEVGMVRLYGMAVMVIIRIENIVLMALPMMDNATCQIMNQGQS